MYWAKQRARVPVVIGFPTTSQLGTLTSCNPASVSDALVAVGFMSGVPVIFCCFNSLVTVCCPTAEITIRRRRGRRERHPPRCRRSGVLDHASSVVLLVV